MSLRMDGERFVVESKMKGLPDIEAPVSPPSWVMVFGAALRRRCPKFCLASSRASKRLDAPKGLPVGFGCSLVPDADEVVAMNRCDLAIRADLAARTKAPVTKSLMSKDRS